MADFGERVFGSIAVRLGYVTPERVAEAVAAQEAAGAGAPPLGAILAERRWLTPEQAAAVLRRQRELFRAPVDAGEAAAEGRLFGQVAVARGLVSAEAVNIGLRVQATRAAQGRVQRLGEILVDIDEVTPEGVLTVVEEQQALLARAGRAAGGQRAQPAPAPAPARVIPARAGPIPHVARPAAPARPAPARPSAPVPALACPPADRTVALDQGEAAAAEAPLSPGPRPVPASHTVDPINVSPGTGVEPPAPAAAPGRARFGKYELVQELGRGGMGIVYKAWHPGLKAYFAVKVLLAGDKATDRDVKRFYREAEATAKLSHPGIVHIHDVGEADGKPYIAMEYIDGAALDKVLADPAAHGLTPARPRAAGAGRGKARVGLAPSEALALTRTVAEALHHAHAAGVIHRDLKPANVLRAKDGSIKVMDFGLARVMDGQERSRLTKSGAVVGTLAYMSPEQAEGKAHHLDARSDVYQIGAVLYELLTGRPPFSARSELDLLVKVMTGDPEPPRGLDPTIPEDAETICLKCLERDPGRRYASARALAEDVGRYLAGEPILARPLGAGEKALRWTRRHRWPLTAAGVLAGLGLGFFGYTRSQMAERTRREAELQAAATATERRETELMAVEGLLRRFAFADARRRMEAFFERSENGADADLKAACLAPLVELDSWWQASVARLAKLRGTTVAVAMPDGTTHAGILVGLDEAKHEVAIEEAGMRGVKTTRPLLALSAEAATAALGADDSARICRGLWLAVQGDGLGAQQMVRGVPAQARKRFALWAGRLGLPMNPGADYRTPYDEEVARKEDEARKSSDEFAKRLKALGRNPEGYEEYEDTKTGIVLIRIPAGEFRMGSEEEGPIHRVFLSEYFIAKYELTNAQYRAFCKATGHAEPKQPDGGVGYPDYFSDAKYDDYPVVGVSWDDAQAFCTWAGVRLPTEAEWERTAGWDARAGRARLYPWGDEEPTPARAVHRREADQKFVKYTEAVGSCPAGRSACGALDLAGNVAEWCQDWCAEKYYASLPDGVRDPQGPASGSYRVLRGGSWTSNVLSLRAGHRFWNAPGNAYCHLGFRVASSR